MSRAASPSGLHLLDGALRVLLAEALFPLTSLLTAACLTRRLGPEGYGLFTLATTITVWVELITSALLARSTYKFVAEAKDWRPVATTVAQLYLIMGCGAALLLWFLAGQIAALLSEPVLASYLRLFAFNIPLFSLAQAHRNILIGMGNFKQQAVQSASRWVMRMLFIVLLVELGFSIPGAICGIIGASLIELVIGRFYIQPPLFRRSTFPVRRLLGYVGPLFLSASSLIFYGRLDLLALQTLGGTTAQVGFYSAAQNLSSLPGLVSVSFAPLLLSSLSRVLLAGNLQLAKEMGRNALRLVFGLLPFAGMSAGVAPEVVRAIYGSTFTPAAPLLAILIFGALALVMISVSISILTAAGRPTWALLATGPLVPLALVGYLLAIPRMGGRGAALVFFIVAWLCALGAVVTIYRLWRILPPAGTIWRSVLISGGAYALAVSWPVSSMLLALKLPIIGLAIGLSYLCLGEFNADEIALIRSLARRRITSTGSSDEP